MAKNLWSLTPTLEDYWRSIILFGRNTASYKFVGKQLIHFGSQQKDTVEAQDMAEIFSKNICTHLRLNDRQGVSVSNSYFDRCRQYNAGQIDKDMLISSTLTNGFTMFLMHSTIFLAVLYPVYFTVERVGEVGQ